jgi:hypothetical protein
MKRVLAWLVPVVAALAVVMLWNLTAPYLGGVVGGVAMAGMFGPLLGLKPKSYERLAADVKAISPEYFPMTWFDSQTYTGGTTVGVQNFFSQTNADVTLSNMQLAGQFPADEYFDVGEVHVDLIARVTAETAGAADSAAVGALDDLMQLMLTGRSLITLINRNKNYGPVPLSQCRPTGAIESGSVAGAFAAATTVQFPGKWDGCGWMFEKTLTLGPTSKFGVAIQWPAVAVTLSNTSVITRVSLRGVHYRLVA